MRKTWGYHQIEIRLRSLKVWPQDKMKYGGLILLIINGLWTMYPLFVEIRNFSNNFSKCLSHLQIITAGIINLSINLQNALQKNQGVKLVDQMSDFSTFGMPKKIRDLDKLLTKVMKVTRRFLFTATIFMSYTSMFFDNTCPKKSLNNTSSTTCNLLVDYYVPFNVKPWQQTLMMLFQIFSIGTIGDILATMMLFYCYTVELLIIRLEDISLKISNIQFNKNRKNNGKLRHVIMYHQHVLKLFKAVTSFTNTLVIPQKFFCIIFLGISAARLALQPEMVTIAFLFVTIIFLLLLHAVGQRITNASLTVQDAIYNMNWYEADVKIQKDVLIFLCMAQRPFVVNMNVFGSLSYATMTAECKSAYAWFNWILKFLSVKKYI